MKLFVLEMDYPEEKMERDEKERQRGKGDPVQILGSSASSVKT